MKTPRELQVERALAEFDFYASARAAVNEMDEQRAFDEQLAAQEPQVFERECRDCRQIFTTRKQDTGTKWTQCCPSCLMDYL